MTHEYPSKLFVTGTDTGVGKTVVSAILSLGLQAGYWKPIQAGIFPTDTLSVQFMTELPKKHFLPETYCLTSPLSPHAAAQIDGTVIHLDNIAIPNHSFPYLIVEGAGGLMVPLNAHQYMIDLIKKLNIPVLLVCRSTLGTINHTLLSIAQLRQYDIPIFGAVLNGPLNPSNKQAIEKYGQIEVLAELQMLSDLSPTSLKKTFNEGFTK